MVHHSHYSVSRRGLSTSELAKIHGLFSADTTMRGDVHREPPPDIEFPYFKVTYYERPESVGIAFKTTDARSGRWPESIHRIHEDGSHISCQPSDEDTQYNWRQKLGELLTDRFLLIDEGLNGMICTSLF